MIVLLAISLGFQTAHSGTFPTTNPAAAEAMKLRVRAAHFLSWATFGPKPQEIENLALRMEAVGETAALEEWIDLEFAKPVTEHEPLAIQMIADDGFTPLSLGIGHTRYREHAWWHSVISADDQLRQRMAWALAQIFVVNQDGAGFNSQINDVSGQPQYLGIVDYYDMLINNAFGNYRELIEDVTYHPIMGVFLTFVKNILPIPELGIEPDENYAREVKQLKSIGLYQLKITGVQKTDAEGELIETYNNEDIKAMARVFTGLTFNDPENNNYEDPFQSLFRAEPNYHDRMVMIDGVHDTDEKTLLTGTTLPAGQTGDKDISDALDELFKHPNVGPFLARRIAQRLVKSNPSKKYIRDMARAFNNNGAGVRGDFKALLKVMLTHSEAFKGLKYKVKPNSNLRVKSKGTEHTRMQEPVVRYTQFMRAFGATPYPNTPPEEEGGWELRCNNRFMIRGLGGVLNQQVYDAPSVFNFYGPDDQPPGPLVGYTPKKLVPNNFVAAPELQIFTAVSANTIANRFRSLVNNGYDAYGLLYNDDDKLLCAITFDFTAETDLGVNPDALMNHLDLLLCHGSMKDSTKSIIASAIAAESDDNATRAKGAILSTILSPDCAVQ